MIRRLPLSRLQKSRYIQCERLQEFPDPKDHQNFAISEIHCVGYGKCHSHGHRVMAWGYHRQKDVHYNVPEEGSYALEQETEKC